MNPNQFHVIIKKNMLKILYIQMKSSQSKWTTTDLFKRRTGLIYFDKSNLIFPLDIVRRLILLFT